MTANTTNGLTYPTGTDPVGDLDTIIQTLAGQLDTKLLAAWTAWNPTFVGATTNPNLGATGGVAGRYKQRGHTVDFQLKVKWLGAGVTVGSGNYSFALPVAPQDTERCAGCWIMTTPNRQGFWRVSSAGNVLLFKQGATSQYGSADATADGVAAGTIIAFAGTYEV